MPNRPWVEFSDSPSGQRASARATLLTDLLQVACDLTGAPAAALFAQAEDGTPWRFALNADAGAVFSVIESGVECVWPLVALREVTDAAGPEPGYPFASLARPVPGTDFAFALSLPLRARAGATLGRLVMLERGPCTLPAEQVEALGALVEEAALLLVERPPGALARALVPGADDADFSQRGMDAALRALIDATEMATVVLDLHGAVRIWSARAEALVEGDGEPLEHRLRDLDAPESLLVAGILHAAHANEAQEMRLRTRQGRRVDVRIRAVIAVDALGQRDGYVGLVDDLTTQRGAERRSRANQALTHALSEVDDIEQALPRVLEALCTTLGWPGGVALMPGEAEGPWTLAASYPAKLPVSLAALRALAEQARATGEVSLQTPSSPHGATFEARALPADGDLPTSRPERRGGRDAAWCMPISTRGRTVALLAFACSRSEADDALLRDKLASMSAQLGQYFERKLVEEERDQFFTLSVDLLSLLSLDGRLVRVNPAWTLTLGFDRAELEGRPLVELVHPDDQAATAEMVSRLAAGVDARGFEHRVLCKDGALRWLSWDCRGARDNHDVLYAAARDLTEHRLKEQHERETEEQRRHAQRLESTGRLAGWTAHYFNNLLTAIMGYSRLLIDRLPDVSPTREYARHILTAGERTAALTQQLLAFSRRQVMNPALIDLNTVVEEMDRMLRPLLGADVELRVTLAPALDRVLADRAQLDQVLLNLVLNARDALTKGGMIVVSTRVVDLAEVDARRRGGLKAGRYVELRVEDTGVGMDEELRAKVFEPFFTTKRLGEGTGLGLSMVYGIVQQSQGHIQLDSAPYAGTTVEVLLPAAGASSTPNIVLPARSERPRVLLVEDEAVVRDVTTEVLRQDGFEVTAAESAEVALRLAFTAGAGFELLVTDVVLAGMTGRQLAHALAGPHPRMKVLYMSGYASHELSRFGIDASQAFLAKPFTPEALAEQVHKLIDVR